MSAAATARCAIAAGVLFFCGCNRSHSTANLASPPPESPREANAPVALGSTPQPPQTAPSLPGQDVDAAWYDVPAHSLAARRAGADGLTAAHNHLPIGTLLRVTHLRSGRSVIVRVTDRGIPRGKAKLDLCRAAAEQLGMIGEGIARVRMEILPQEAKLGADAELQPSTPSH